jgi:ElaB/YqjD/DUF883 family membrane-anchored ribosome-binding protein
MNDEKKYGVKLELDLSDFKTKIQETTAIVNKVQDKFKQMKQEFETGLNIDIEANDAQLDALKEKLKDLVGNVEFDIDTDGNLVVAKENINEFKQAIDNMAPDVRSQINNVLGDIQALSKDTQTIETSPFAKIGQATNDLKQKISSLGNNMREVFKRISTSAGEGINKLKEMGQNALNSSKKITKLKSTSQSAGNSILQSFQKGTTSLKRFALALIGVQSAYRMVTKAMTSYMSYDTSLQQSLQNTWAGFGSFLAPVLERVIALFQKLLAYANAVMKALTGVNLVARANAKAMSSSAESASSANKALAGFDELQNINQDTGSDSSSGDTGTISIPDIDTSSIESFIEKVKSLLETLFEPIQSAWDTYGQGVMDSFWNALNQIWVLIKSIGQSFAEVWTNGTGQQTVELILQIITDIFNLIGNVAETWKNAWVSDGIGTQIIQNLADGINNLLGLIEDVAQHISEWWKTDEAQTFADSVLGIVETLSGFFEYVTGLAKDLWENGLSKIWDSLQTIGTNGTQLLDDILKDIEPVYKFFAKLVEKFLEITASTIADALNSVGDALKWIDEHEAVKAFLEGIAIAIGAIVAIITIFNVVGAVASAVTTVLGIAINILTSPITLVIIAIGALIAIIILIVKHWDDLKEAGKKCWEKIKEVWNTAVSWFEKIGTKIGNAFSKIWDKVKTTAKTAINGIIGYFNKWIDGFNSMLTPVRKVIVAIAKAFGKDVTLGDIKIPSIPKLKIGTDMVKEEGLAYLHAGEQVVPADVVKGGYTRENNDETNSLLRELIQIIDDKNLNVSIGKNDIGKASVDYIRNQRRITGGSVI